MNIVVPGTEVAGRYRVVRLLGAGGMGTVVEATHLQLAQRVAIKFLLPELCSQRDAVTRFLREARAAVQIESEHVARVMDVGTSEEGVPFLVMEYLEGMDLAQLLHQQKRLPIAQAVSLIVQAADAIAEAHVLGVIHRDLKPSNLFLAARRDGTHILKVLDFGISKAVAESTTGGFATRTATATVMGSPHYMSPEQVRSSKSVDPRADIWSLGVILHELLAGEPPFRGESLPGVLASIVADAPASLRKARPDVPSALEAVVACCLQKDREARFASIPELARALAPLTPVEAHAALARVQSFAKVELRTQSLTPPAAVAGPAPAHSPLPPLPPSDTQRGFARALKPKQERRLGLVVAGLLGGLSIAFAYLGYRPNQSASSVSPAGAVSAAKPSSEPSGISSLTSDSQLAVADWERIEIARSEGVAQALPSGTKLDDQKLFEDRK
jgi:eukaryotic-like serine/threonine-protein kinase